MENILRTCLRCGEPSLVEANGSPFVKRCRCEVEAAALARMRATVHPQFLGDHTKTMSDWDPPLFSAARAGPAWRYMRAQRAMAIKRLWDFCFADDGRAILASVSAGRNLFVRGPRNSGKGLLSAAVKAVAAIKQVSATPFACEFDVFRSEMMACMSFGRDGAEAKAVVADKYLDVQLMVMENVRAESTIKFSGEEAKAKFKGSNQIDSLLANRAAAKGSLLLTSCDFIGEISTTLGERLFEDLSGDRTALLLLLSPDEAAEVTDSLSSVYASRVATFHSMLGGEVERRTLDSRNDDENIIMVEDGFYVEEAFDSIPGTGKLIQSHIEGDPSGVTPAIRDKYAEFRREKERNGSAYKRGLAAARAQVVRASGACNEAPVGRPPCYRMTKAEVAELGGTLSLACSSEERLASAEAKAAAMLAKMSGDEK
jgi:hypothetical protein